MESERIRDLWASLTAGDRLGDAEQRELLEALSADPKLRAQLMDDQDLDSALRALGQGGHEADSFLRDVTDRLAAESTGDRFIHGVMTRVEGGRRRLAVWAAACLLGGLAVVLAFVAFRPRSQPSVGTREVSEAPPASVDAEALKSARQDLARREEMLRREAERLAAEEQRARERLLEIERERERLIQAQKTAEARKQAEALEEERRELARLEARRKEAEAERAKAEAEKRKTEEEVVRAEARKTVAAIARLHAAEGEVYIVTDADRKPAQAGDELLPGEGLETVGPWSVATLAFADRTRVQLWGDTGIRKLAEQGKSFRLAQGAVTADVVKQPAHQPMVFSTAHGEATVLATSLTLVTSPSRMRLDVMEGKVRLTRRDDGKWVDVNRGHFAVVQPGVELKATPFQDPDKKSAQFHPRVSQKQVDEAVRRGVDFLRKAPSPGANGIPNCDELILLTFIHAGVPETDSKFQQLLQSVLSAPLAYTYSVSLQAMCLEELHRVKYQARIHQCAQFLVDNQTADGYWSYGTPTEYEKTAPVPSPTRDVATGTARPPSSTRPKGAIDFEAPPPGPRTKPRVFQWIPVKKNRDGSPGDHSNSQYAALGLRACHDAGIVLPKEVIELARKWLRDSQRPDKGGAKDAYPAKGWTYRLGGENPYGSMTAGAIGCMIIYDYILDGAERQTWKKDPVVQSGLAWLAKNFSVTENPGGPGEHGDPKGLFIYYYLYALERVGMLYGTDLFGKHDWYFEGAKVLLKDQKPDGSWDKQDPLIGTPTYDTCFAILFLKRATRPVRPDVASEDRLHKKGEDK